MKAKLLKRSILVAALLLSVSTIAGCTSVVVPLSPEVIAMTDDDDGLLFGHIHLTQDGKDRSTGLRWPIDMKWSIEEKTHKRKLLIAHLPVDGPFVVKLPAGSYRITGISFDSTRGVWHTLLPARFDIQPGACTSLGIWKLQMRTRFFAGWITREVFNGQELAQDDPWKILAARGCPVLAPPLESPVGNSLRLSFHTRGTDFSILSD